MKSRNQMTEENEFANDIFRKEEPFSARGRDNDQVTNQPNNPNPPIIAGDSQHQRYSEQQQGERSMTGDDLQENKNIKQPNEGYSEGLNPSSSYEKRCEEDGYYCPQDQEGRMNAEDKQFINAGDAFPDEREWIKMKE